MIDVLLQLVAADHSLNSLYEKYLELTQELSATTNEKEKKELRYTIVNIRAIVNDFYSVKALKNSPLGENISNNPNYKRFFE